MRGVEIMFVLSVRFFDKELIEDVVDVLEVGDVTASTYNSVCAYLEKTFDIVVAGERAIRCYNTPFS